MAGGMLGILSEDTRVNLEFEKLGRVSRERS
jgi:hypothetical protein